MEIIPSNTFSYAINKSEEYPDGVISFLLNNTIISKSHYLSLIVRDRNNGTSPSSIELPIITDAIVLRILFESVLYQKDTLSINTENLNPQHIFDLLSILSFIFPQTQIVLTTEIFDVIIRTSIDEYPFDLKYTIVKSSYGYYPPLIVDIDSDFNPSELAKMFEGLYFKKDIITKYNGCTNKRLKEYYEQNKVWVYYIEGYIPVLWLTYPKYDEEFELKLSNRRERYIKNLISCLLNIFRNFYCSDGKDIWDEFKKVIIKLIEKYITYSRFDKSHAESLKEYVEKAEIGKDLRYTYMYDAIVRWNWERIEKDDRFVKFIEQVSLFPFSEIRRYFETEDMFERGWIEEEVKKDENYDINRFIDEL